MDDDEPPQTSPHRHAVTPQRLLGAVGTCALLGVLVAIVVMIAAAGGGEEPAPRAAASPAPSPTATPSPKPRRPPLTAEQKAERRAAVDAMAQQGFRPVSLRTFRGDRDLRVIIGRSGTSPFGERAFFFVGGDYIGTDVVDSSERVRVVRNGPSSVTLSYALFDPGGVEQSASAKVRFEWDGTSLLPQDEIPPVSERGPR